MARKAKNLFAEKGILSTPNPHPGHSLPQESVDLVTEFYQNDEVSRVMPGKKDFVSVKQVDGRVHVQKRLVLCNLKELYKHLKDRFPAEKIGFSKFAELRPKNCILTGVSGTHAVCVCTIHQNVKLMLIGAKIPQLTAEDVEPILTYHDGLARIIRNPALPKCYLGECNHCPGIDELKEQLTTVLDENMIDKVIYKQWLSVDRTTLETLSASSDQFVDTLCEKVELLLPHSFIASQQAAYYSEQISSLQQGELLIVADFSENYAFVLQDAAQGFHWNNAQATIHPFVIYYSDGEKVLGD